MAVTRLAPWGGPFNVLYGDYGDKAGAGPVSHQDRTVKMMHFGGRLTPIVRYSSLWLLFFWRP